MHVCNVGMHVRMVCMYVCMYVCIVPTHAYIHTSIHACMHAMQCNACNAMHACMHACMHAGMHAETHTCVCTSIFLQYGPNLRGCVAQRELRAKAHQKGLSDSRRDSIWWPWPSEGWVETPRTRTSLSDRSKNHTEAPSPCLSPVEQCFT